jgi:K+-sensing histidine kinase KdpD
VASTADQKKALKKIVKKLDFLEEESEEDTETDPTANNKITRIYEPIIGLDKLVVKVSDNGVGIAQRDKPKLFKLFGTNQNSYQSLTQGIGLGLVICESIVDQFNGEIDFISEKDKGSHFVFSFQLDDVPMEQKFR